MNYNPNLHLIENLKEEVFKMAIIKTTELALKKVISELPIKDQNEIHKVAETIMILIKKHESNGLMAFILIDTMIQTELENEEDKLDLLP